MIKLSILIPVYNAEKYIALLLDCIIQQMDDNTEIILLNDGSRDSSESICAEYADKYPLQIKFISRENRGAVRTRRELFQAAIGEWIWIVDSDDMLPNGALPIIMNIITENELSDMILFDYYVDAEEGRVVHQLSYEDGKTFENKNKKDIYKKVIRERELNPLWNKVFKRDCIDFNIDYSDYEDVKKANDCLQMIPIITNSKKLIYRRIPLYIYNTKNENSLSHKFHDYTYTSLKKVWQRKKTCICQWGMWEELQEDYYKQCAVTAVSLLRKYACSDKTKQEYFIFFERMIEDGVFSEAINNCDASNFIGSEKLLISLIKRKRRELSYVLFLTQHVISNKR